ncbi:MAG: DUF6268 family outer membrane beta-barrel protein, partial [Campylobacterales bacterium]|nr:DUF6268 family outer membrane beta-barrel protein [Campylobacterales bacterium]
IYGVGYGSNYGTPSFGPILGYKKKTDNWLTSILLPVNASIAYQGFNRFQLGTRIKVKGNNYRFTSSSIDHGIVRFSNVKAGFFTKYRINKIFNFNCEIGHTLDRKIELYDSHKEIMSDNIDNQTFFNFGISLEV